MKINVGKTAVWKIGSPPHVVFNNYVRDVLRFQDSMALNRAYFDGPPTDNLNLTDAEPGLAYGGTIRDRLNFVDAILSAADAQGTVSDNLRFLDLILFALDERITDSLNLSDTIAYQYAVPLAIQDVLNLSDSVSPHVAAYTVLSELLSFSDWTGFSFEGSILDSLNLSDSIQEKLAANNAILDTLKLIDAVPEPSLWLMMPVVSDNLDLSDNQESTATVFNAIKDELKFIALLIDGDDTYSGWAINTRHAAASRMTNYNFNSMHRVGGTVYGASSTGLYKLEGDDDAGTGIDPELTTGYLDLANARQTRVREMYLGVLADAKIIIKTVDSEGVERWYESHTPSGNVNTVRIPLGRKPSSRLWQFKVTRQPGTKFELNRIEMFPVLLRRRVKNG